MVLQLKKIANALKQNYELEINDIPEDNLEITINSPLIGGEYATIDFQKQNQSFIFVASLTLEKSCIDNIISIVSSAVEEDIFADYKFKDLMEYGVYHWVYGNREHNRNILESLKSNSEIVDLSYHDKIIKKKK